MCGIAGYFGSGDLNLNSRVRSALSLMHHRGPDEALAVSSRWGSIGACRLAISDPAHNSQPYFDRVSGSALAFNGEVFNHESAAGHLSLAERRGLRTNGDTEVLFALLNARGVDGTLSVLDAQFALAFVDSDGVLYLARDYAGVLPLYYSVSSEGLFFASEVNALLALTGDRPLLDYAACFEFFANWGARPESSVFPGIYEIPPGSAWRAKTTDLKNAGVHFRWGPSRVEASPESLRSAISLSVRSRVPRDVSGAILLSGGLDSSIIASAAAESGVRVAYSVDFADPIYSEKAWQQRAAHRFGLELSTLMVDGEALARVLPEVVAAAAAPLTRLAPAATYLLGQKVSADGVKVVLSGEGADELFGGYSVLKQAAGLQSDPGSELPEGGVARFDEVPLRRTAGGIPIGHAARLALLKGLSPYLGSVGRQFQREALERASLGLGAVLADVPDLLAGSAFNLARWTEFRIFLGSGLLASQSDRQLMRHSVEGRFPFLSLDVIQEAWSRDDVSLVGAKGDKLPLRQGFESVIGTDLAWRPKQAYTAPAVLTLTSPTGLQLVDRLESCADASGGGVFAPRPVRWLCNRTRAGAISREQQRIMLFLISCMVLDESLGGI